MTTQSRRGRPVPTAGEPGDGAIASAPGTDLAAASLCDGTCDDGDPAGQRLNCTSAGLRRVDVLTDRDEASVVGRRRIDLPILDLDRVAAIIAERRDQWEAEHGLVANPVTWVDADADWPRPLLTDPRHG